MTGIVVGVDGSRGAHPALEWAAREAAIRNAPLTVMYVHEVAVSYWIGAPILYGIDATEQENERRLLDEMVQKVLAGADRRPASASVTAVSGAVMGELIAAAAGADLLVVGARGGSGLGSAGSVSSRLIHHAPCPVVVVPS